MALAPKLLNPFKHSFLSSLTSKRLLSGKIDPVRTWIKQHEPATHNHYERFLTKFNCRPLQYIRNVYSSGSKFSTGCAICVPAILGAVTFSSQFSHAMDGLDILVEDLNGLDEEEDSRALWMFVRKLWLPTNFILILLLNWDHPLMLLTKIVLFLFATKPSPLSVYVFIDQLCQESMRQEPHLYFVKSLYANKVEVQDYKFLCLATIEVRGEKLTVLGILGGWWALPLS